MKRINLLLTTLLISISAFATDWFPFKEVNHKWNISLNGGYNHVGKVGLYGLGATVRGFHVMLGGTGSSHRNDMHVGVWKEKSSYLVHAGYQIPIVKSFRIIPVVGVAGVGEVVTNGYDYEFPNTTVENKVTSSLKYKFDYGAHLVFKHRKLIVNVGATRYTVLGGLGLEF